MNIIRRFTDCPIQARHSVIALGNFDGVHRGHQVVIHKAQEVAARLNRPSAVLTFEPHPISVLRANIPPFRITPFREKALMMQHFGVDTLFIAHFTQALRTMPAKEFVREILLKQLQVSHVVIGHDFIFGHNREGNADLLRDVLSEENIELTQVSPVTHSFSGDDTEVFSSTRIREHIRSGDIPTVTTLLGHDYVIKGRVRIGDQRGRLLGFPTANVRLRDHIRPAFGVYAVEVNIGKETIWRPAIANIGQKPTFGSKHDLAEIHIFDFSNDIYNKRIRIRIIHFIRAEQKFASANELIAQITEDCNIARQFFAKRITSLDNNQ